MIFSNKIGIACLLLVVHQCTASTNQTSDENDRTKKVLSIFNVVTFPNTPCGGTSGYNGTCYTASECISKGGTASGTCASSFGVCCIFSLSCGGTTSENNTYAIISSYSISSDEDPCSYTVCKLNSDVCKLRIDFDTMVLEGPYATTTAAADGPRLGDCIYDTLTVTNPGGPSPPVICGYNTGQHMFVPASSGCNTINIDIDTGTTTTTRKWQIKVTQFQCGNQMAPEQDCLQYFTAQKGTIATFNWDTSATTVSASQIHLSSQFYDICIRRQKSYCSLCLSPEIAPASSAKVASSYGLGSSSDGTNSKSASGSTCTGLTTQPADTGYGDYIEIANLQPSIGSAGTISTSTRMCGAIFDANPTASTAQATACTFATPFKIGVHFDEGESLTDTASATPDLNKGENVASTGLETNEGYGYSGFYMAYWMNSC
jgi:hypothetical protein